MRRRTRNRPIERLLGAFCRAVQVAVLPSASATRLHIPAAFVPVPLRKVPQMRGETCPPLRPGIRPSRVYSLCHEWHSEQRLFEDRKLHEAILCCVPVPTRYAPEVPG